jgi:2-polyprenyl-3-methyl-5-hydroxy-6-metoxy-1,4-benzoquinol methylase/uracil phosphoribosyltransferase
MTNSGRANVLYKLLHHAELDDAAAREIVSLLASNLAHCVKSELGAYRDQQILLVPILRGGLLVYPAFINTFRYAAVGLFQISRHNGHRTVLYESLPEGISPNVILYLDAVAATGNTIICASQLIKRHYGEVDQRACLITATRSASTCIRDAGITVDGISTDELDIGGLVVPDLGCRDAGDLAYQPAQRAASTYSFPITEFERLHAGDDRISAMRNALIYGPVLEVAGSREFKRVLDIGCGGGNLTRALSRIAATVVGFDPSEEAIKLATDTNYANNITFTSEPPDLMSAPFDLVVCCMALNAAADFEEIVKLAVRCSATEAVQVWVILHPAFQYNQSQWRARKNVSVSGMHVSHSLFPSYFDRHQYDKYIEGLRIAEHHRPLSTYLNVFLRSGLSLLEMKEPRPDDPNVSIVDHLMPRIAVFVTCTRNTQLNACSQSHK